MENVLPIIQHRNVPCFLDYKPLGRLYGDFFKNYLVGLERSKSFLEKNRQGHNLKMTDQTYVFLVLHAAYFVVREEGI